MIQLRSSILLMLPRASELASSSRSRAQLLRRNHFTCYNASSRLDDVSGMFSVVFSPRLLDSHSRSGPDDSRHTKNFLFVLLNVDEKMIKKEIYCARAILDEEAISKAIRKTFKDTLVSDPFPFLECRTTCWL
jgi:hypothetical protein